MRLSEYASALPKLEKTRYTEKLVSIKCIVDPYIDENFSCGSLPAVGYDYLVCSSNNPSCDGKPANALKLSE